MMNFHMRRDKNPIFLMEKPEIFGGKIEITVSMVTNIQTGENNINFFFTYHIVIAG